MVSKVYHIHQMSTQQRLYQETPEEWGGRGCHTTTPGSSPTPTVCSEWDAWADESTPWKKLHTRLLDVTGAEVPQPVTEFTLYLVYVSTDNSVVRASKRVHSLHPPPSFPPCLRNIDSLPRDFWGEVLCACEAGAIIGCGGKRYQLSDTLVFTVPDTAAAIVASEHQTIENAAVAHSRTYTPDQLRSLAAEKTHLPHQLKEMPRPFVVALLREPVAHLTIHIGRRTRRV